MKISLSGIFLIFNVSAKKNLICVHLSKKDLNKAENAEKKTKKIAINKMLKNVVFLYI